MTTDRRSLLALMAAGIVLPSQTLLAAESAPHDAIPPFKPASGSKSVAEGWMHQPLPKVDRQNQFALVDDGGSKVLQVKSDKSASSYATAVTIDPAKTPWLHWRWKVSHALDGSDISKKPGDDFAARVYVLFDLPLDQLSFGDQLKIRAARALSGGDVPAAALCYVWGKVQAVGFTGWNAYTDRLRMIVVESGASHAGEWRSESRDVAKDFRAAFQLDAPPVGGIAVSADTDNTGDSVEAWFGDLSFSASR